MPNPTRLVDWLLRRDTIYVVARDLDDCDRHLDWVRRHHAAITVKKPRPFNVVALSPLSILTGGLDGVTTGVVYIVGELANGTGPNWDRLEAARVATAFNIFATTPGLKVRRLWPTAP